ncbi:MAG: hypothetical protein DRH44_06205 [Candidatus Coatesbacteria bacterium]|nr:MAG: hypothetical protein DRH44_06205 [Candidatus Coatesbacteria bacterium]
MTRDTWWHISTNNRLKAETFLRENITADRCICHINAGYSTGWCNESLENLLYAIEIKCRAKGDDVCFFVMTHRKHIYNA